MLLASSVICGLFTIITAAAVICHSHILPSASVVIVLTAPTNRLGEIIRCIFSRISLYRFLSLYISLCVRACVRVCA